MAKDKEDKITTKALKAKKDTKDARKNLKIELNEGESKREFITKLGKKICGEWFSLPQVH